MCINQLLVLYCSGIRITCTAVLLSYCSEGSGLSSHGPVYISRVEFHMGGVSHVGCGSGNQQLGQPELIYEWLNIY